jgi:hypothetical protein
LKASENLVDWNLLGPPINGTGGFVTLRPQLQNPLPEKYFFTIEELP